MRQETEGLQIIDEDNFYECCFFSFLKKKIVQNYLSDHMYNKHNVNQI